jgi:hypothetical protein
LLLDGNPHLAAAGIRMAWPTALTAQTAGGVRIRLWLPPDLDTSEVIKYPLLLNL